MATVSSVENPTEEAASQPRPSLLAALRVRDFRLVWIGESVSLLGDQFYMIALPWLTLQLTGSGLALGTVAAVTGIPRAVFMVVGGAFTDRFSPRTVMLVSNVLRLLLTAFLTITVLTSTVQLWMLYVTGLLFGLVDAFFFPAQSAIVPQIVEKEQIESGNALVQITAQLSGFIGPALAGLIIAAMSGSAGLAQDTAVGTDVAMRGVGLALGFDVLTFVVAAIALWLMRGGKQAATAGAAEPQQSIRESIAEGLRAVWSDKPLLTMLLITMAINFLFTGPVGVGLPVLANTRFTEGAAALGIMLSAFGGGALVGALLGGSLPAPKRMGVRMMILIAVAGTALGLFGFASNLPLAGVMAIVMGMAIGYVNVLGVSWLQKRTDPALLGRVMSLVMLGSFGLGPISNAVAGILVDVNLSVMFVGAGVLLVVVGLLAATNREVRGMT